ncbi:MAG: methylenetetrahydrofolate reductase [NAD(P)H] [Planctomycetota bacterium]
MSLAQHFQSDSPVISFELFPPKTEKGFKTLEKNVQQLLELNPAFFTCTYGAGGSSQAATLDVVSKVKKMTGLPIASHLTCVGSTVSELVDYLNRAVDVGCDYIVALRGDPPKGEDSFTAVEGGLRYANELVDLIKDKFPSLGIIVAGYPEVHQEAPDAQTDLLNLKRKVDAGADIIVTQLFYDNADYFAFVDQCHDIGIEIPIVPGILPVTNFAQAERIAKLCKARIPDELRDPMLQSDAPEHQFEVGVDHARRQSIELLDRGVPGIHYYVLNKSEAAKALMEGMSMPAGG